MDRRKKEKTINLLVCGAKLQGTEVIYLAKEAGYHVTVIDKNPTAPGIGLADEYVRADIKTNENIKKYMQKADVVIPVIEDIEILERIVELGKKINTKVLFDLDAYRISSSKNKSNALFEKLKLPIPGKYPNCQYPVILKPDHLSGSCGVKKAYSQAEVDTYRQTYGEREVVVQEFLDGPSYSLEVLGDGKHFSFPQITEVVVDEAYDCKRIIAPAVIDENLSKQMFSIAEKLAKELAIKGIFDIEVIAQEGKLKLLEIDARFPSQTPISVYHSTGINMVEQMVEQALGRLVQQRKQNIRHCIYQQVVVSGKKIEVLGEHVIGSCHRLKRIKDFYGADEVMTDYFQGADEWKAIVIITRDTQEQAFEAFAQFQSNIAKIQTEKAG